MQNFGFYKVLCTPGNIWKYFTDLIFLIFSACLLSLSHLQILFCNEKTFFFFFCSLSPITIAGAKKRGELLLVSTRISLRWWAKDRSSLAEVSTKPFSALLRKAYGKGADTTYFQLVFLCQLCNLFCLFLQSDLVSFLNATASEATAKHPKYIQLKVS